MAGVVRWLRLRALRWVLPVMLVFGVCLMHTLGHLASGHGGAVHEGMDPPAQAAVEPVSAVVGEPARTLTVVAAEPMVAAAAGPQSGVGFDPMAVCLAVLTSLLVLVLSMVAVRVPRRASYGGEATTVAAGTARSPPRRTAVSLSELSVMRT